MKKVVSYGAGIIAAVLLAVTAAYAHTPLCSCSDNGDKTITCEGGFSDGSTAAGVSMSIKDKSGKTLIKGKMDKNSSFTFKKPAGSYKVVFDAGPGHIIEVDGKNITE